MDESNSINREIIASQNDLYKMLDSFFGSGNVDWWNDFYSDREKAIPFFTDAPDENLFDYVESGKVKSGNFLEIGCGNGRNARFLANSGFNVHAIDFSQEAIDWAKAQSEKYSLEIDYQCVSIFDADFENKTFDFIYDSGCLHHLKPHRRIQYLRIVQNLLSDGGKFGLVCFNPKGGVNISDYDVYRNFSMQGGLAFTQEKLEKILNSFFEIVEFREMKNVENQNLFGKDFLWTLLLHKRLSI